MKIEINKNIFLIVFLFSFIGINLISLVYVWSHYALIYYIFSISILNLFFTLFITLKLIDKDKENFTLDSDLVELIKGQVKTKKEDKEKKETKSKKEGRAK